MVCDVFLVVDCGEIVVFFGENGVGKLILIKIFGGIYKFDVGWVLIDGELYEYWFGGFG